jgi:hypothetical protein
MRGSFLKDGSPESVGMDPARIERLRKLPAGLGEQRRHAEPGGAGGAPRHDRLHKAFGVRRQD